MAKRLLLFVSLALLSAACRPVYVMIDDTDTAFTLSTERVDEILPYLNQRIVPNAVQGRARVQVSTPNERERLVVQFIANHEESTLRIRNSLGIEGGRIHTDKDSVMIYDRLESTAWKVSRDEGDAFFIQGISGLNIMEILYPDFSEGFRSRMYVSDTSYLLRSNSGRQYIINKDNYELQKVIFPNDRFFTWTEFSFSHFQQQNEYNYPARVQILSSDKKSNIFMLIQSVEFNPADISFSLDIPAHIPIERL